MSRRTASDNPAYRVIKRRMKAVLETLQWHAAEGRVPPAEDIRDFCADARAMAAFPGVQGAGAEPFLEAVGRMEAACARGDASALAQALGLAREARDVCHARRVRQP